jgi:lycopene beta-cyclase
LKALKKYDYIITGAGCAGLSLLLRMIKSGKFSTTQFLLIDKDTREHNARTWCFWEEGKGFFEEIVYKKWDHIWFHGDNFSKNFTIGPYQYKMVRGKDFFEYCFKIIREQPNIDLWQGNISTQCGKGNQIEITLDGKEYQFPGAVLFTSIWDENKIKSEQKKAFYLLQHFKGWTIETPVEKFDAEQAVLMDFRVSQQYGTTFGYILPLDNRRALVEYTLFTEQLLPLAEYDRQLKNYLHTFLKLDDYTITEEEFGVIPMTNAQFSWFANGMYHIGTAGGQTKASSGYTFQFIQKQCAAITENIISGTLSEKKSPSPTPAKYRFYDSILLRILSEKKLTGDKIFTRLFQKNSASAVLKFLDNNTSLKEDISIISSLPTVPFLKAALNEWLG